MCNFGMHPGILAIFNFIEKPLNNPIEYDLFKNFTLEHRHSWLWWWWSGWRLLPAFSSHSAATWWDFPPFRWTCRQSARNHSASTVPWFESCDLPPSRWLTSSQGPKDDIRTQLKWWTQWRLCFVTPHLNLNLLALSAGRRGGSSARGNTGRWRLASLPRRHRRGLRSPALS